MLPKMLFDELYVPEKTVSKIHKVFLPQIIGLLPKKLMILPGKLLGREPLL